MSDRPKRNCRPPKQIYVPDENIRFTDDFTDDEDDTAELASANTQHGGEGDEDLEEEDILTEDEDDEEEEEEDLPSDTEFTKQGYIKDGFVVDDDEDDEDYVDESGCSSSESEWDSEESGTGASDVMETDDAGDDAGDDATASDK